VHLEHDNIGAWRKLVIIAGARKYGVLVKDRDVRRVAVFASIVPSKKSMLQSSKIPL
jgi:hypothetical protein